MLEKFKQNRISLEAMKFVRGGGACTNLNNCYASRDGACQYSSDYGTCMSNQAAACDRTFLPACAQE